MRALLLPLLFLIPAAYAQQPAPAPAAPGGVRTLRDLPYVPNAAPRQRLDLYLPAQPGGAPRPLVAWIHGGGWRAGSKSGCPALGLLPLGYDAASIEYRFSQDAIYPAQIQDCKAAIRWLRAHAAQYGYDPNRIGVWGASAGGHLVAMLGVTGRVSDFDTGANLDQSSAVQCVVDFYGPADFLRWGNAVPDPSRAPAGSVIEQLLGGPVATHPALARQASPVYFVTKDAAPFLILHGDHDPLVPLQQSQELQAALQKDGVESTLQVVPGAGHGGAGFSTPENLKLINDFLNRHLKPAE
jgi:acetyl esterase/lipase